jgi:predicted DNA-binding transcriptional regulator AlpA
VAKDLEQSPGSSDEALHHDREARVTTAPDLRMAERLVSIREIREFFGLGRTAAYELTHRHGFPAPIIISPRCYRWWASEVKSYVASIQRDGAHPRQHVRAQTVRGRRASHPSTSQRRISGRVRAARARREPS